MYEFEHFVYLDVQKTGSSFICAVLEHYSNESPIQKIRHAGFKNRVDRTKFHFISLRDPLDQYISLYSYGSQANGKFFFHLHKRGFGDLYEGTWRGFQYWLDFILDPENAQFLPDGYARLGALSDAIGYQSYRVLGLSMDRANRALSHCETRQDVAETYRKSNIIDHVVRFESLRDDLVELVTTKLRDRVTDVDATVAYIRSQAAWNPSSRVDRYEINPKLGGRRRKQLIEREWPFYELWGYSPELRAPA
jgi:hypothetical protein